MTNSKNLVEDDEPTIEDSFFEINSMAEYQKNMKEIKKEDQPRNTFSLQPPNTTSLPDV